MNDLTDEIIEGLSEPLVAPVTRTNSLLWGMFDSLFVGLSVAGVLDQDAFWWVWIFIFLIAFPAAVGNWSNFVHYKELRADYVSKETFRRELLEEALRRDV